MTQSQCMMYINSNTMHLNTRISTIPHQGTHLLTLPSVSRARSAPSQSKHTKKSATKQHREQRESKQPRGVDYNGIFKWRKDEQTQQQTVVKNKHKLNGIKKKNIVKLDEVRKMNQAVKKAGGKQGKNTMNIKEDNPQVPPILNSETSIHLSTNLQNLSSHLSQMEKSSILQKQNQSQHSHKPCLPPTSASLGYPHSRSSMLCMIKLPSLKVYPSDNPLRGELDRMRRQIIGLQQELRSTYNIVNILRGDIERINQQREKDRMIERERIRKEIQREQDQFIKNQEIEEKETLERIRVNEMQRQRDKQRQMQIKQEQQRERIRLEQELYLKQKQREREREREKEREQEREKEREREREKEREKEREQQQQQQQQEQRLRQAQEERKRQERRVREQQRMEQYQYQQQAISRQIIQQPASYTYANPLYIKANIQPQPQPHQPQVGTPQILRISSSSPNLRPYCKKNCGDICRCLMG